MKFNELAKYSILDSQPDEAFDDVSRLASVICGASNAFIVFHDKEKEFVKSNIGKKCSEFVFQVNLTARDGETIGSLGVSHSKPLEIGDHQKKMLINLSKHLIDILELRESELKHRLLFIQSADAIMTLEPPHWSFTSVNPAGLKLFGASSSDEFCSIGPWIVSPEFQPDGESSGSKAARMIQLAMEQGQHFFEWMHCRIDGTLIPCTVQLSRINKGDSTYLQGTVRDISTQKKFEKELQRSHKLLDLALESAKIGIWEWYVDTNEAHYDARYASILGLDFHQLDQNLESWEKRVHPDDLEHVKTDFNAFLLKKNTVYENIHRMRHADGHWVYVLVRGKISEFTEDERPLRMTGTLLDISEIKNLEHEVIEAQSISKIGSYKFNLITGERSWSKENFKIYEIEPTFDLRLDSTYRDKIHPDDRSKFEYAVDRAIKFGEDFSLNHRLLFDGGSRVKHVQVIAKVSKDTDGRPVLVRGICRDRTSDVESDQKYSSLLDSMSEGVVILDSHGHIIQHNNSALRIVGLTSPELTGRKKIRAGWRAIREDGTDFPFRDHPAINAIKTGNSFYDIKMGIRLNPNETRWISLNAIPIHFPEGRRVLCTFSDITALVKAVDENKFVLDTLGIGMWKTNLEIQDQVWDKSMFNLYEITPEEFHSTHDAWMKLLTPESRLQVDAIWQNIMGGSNEFSSNYEIITKTGVRKFIGGKGKVVRNAGGQAVSLYGINWDRTKEVELENNLFLERAKSLHNSKLASIGQLAAGVGHEINNPLSIISGHLGLALKSMDNGTLDKTKLLERFKKMDDAVVRIVNIVKGLRTFARSDDNQLSSFDIYESLSETLDLMKEIYEKEGVSISMLGNHRKSFIYGNRGRLQQVIVNLISNAKDATLGRFNRKIDIEIVYAKDELKLIFTDNGTGIPESIQEKIFEPFFTTKDVNKGTGIGLSLVNTIVKEHAGKIELQSTVGKGTSFIITLPVHYDEVPENKSQIPIGPIDTKVFNRKVLIVDDEDDLREVLVYLFGLSCSKVVGVSSGEKALALLKKENFDLVISDINMPDMNGFILLQTIRKNDNISQPRFLFITGGVDIGEQQQAIINTQTDGLLSKPFKEELILETIQNLFKDY